MLYLLFFLQELCCEMILKFLLAAMKDINLFLLLHNCISFTDFNLLDGFFEIFIEGE